MRAWLLRNRCGAESTALNMVLVPYKPLAVIMDWTAATARAPFNLRVATVYKLTI